MFRTEAQSTQRFFKDLSDLLFVSFAISERGRIVHRGFSKLGLLPSVSSVISVRSENGMGGTKCFAQRHKGLRGF